MLTEIFVQVALIHLALSAPEIRFPNNDEPVLAPPAEVLKPTLPSTSTSRHPTTTRVEPEWTQPLGPLGENSREFWQSSGQESLRQALLKEPNKNVAKNLIILVADGMSIATQMAARVYLGGENKVLSFEEFPYVGLSKTYCVDFQVPDSACTSTAFLSGIKTNFGVLSMSANVALRNCTGERDKNEHVDSIFKFAQDAGKATGIVTNTRVTHATSAAAYAKSASRYWENDSETPKDSDCQDIAHQLIHGEIGKNFDVIMGGGYREFIPRGLKDPHGRTGRRTDQRDLVREWLYFQDRAMFVHDRATLNTLNARYVTKLFGLFSESHMEYHLNNDKGDEPSLFEMTKKALQMVSKNPKGFVLMVESGRIDHAHHANHARLALEEVAHLNDVVDFIKSHVDLSETLIVLTADHSHTMTVSGYPKRGSDILTLGDFSREDEMPYFTLSYANGMGFYDHFNESGRINPWTWRSYRDPKFRQPTTVPLYESTHAGDDVGVYAIGPYSHLFTGVYEQHFIAHAMMYATCLAPEDYLKAPACDSTAVRVSWAALLLLIAACVVK